MFGRRHKQYTRPRKAYDSLRIQSENQIVKKYGLKNKREIWKADAMIATLRNQAKGLIGRDQDAQGRFIEKLKKLKFPVQTIADVLALDKEDLLKRRLQTIVFEKRLAHTPEQARQLIVHKHIMVDKSVVNIPSYLVNVEEENKISFKLKKPVAAEEKHGN